jgi:hypothetical protein
MTEAERKRLDHVVLPRRLPGLALLERYFPSPADNVLDAELASFAASGDTILDPWSGTGWTARRAVSHGMRVVAAEASPFAQMAAQAFLLSPEVAAVDAAFAQLASSRRVDIPLRQHIEELYASRCPNCNRPVVVEEFIWPRDGDAPGRKVYRCTACDISFGGTDERVAAVDEADYAKLGLEPPSPAKAPGIEPAADADEDLPPAPMGLIGEPLEVDEPALAPLGEPGGPPPPPARAPDPPVAIGAEEGPRYASTVRPVPIPASVGTDVRQGLAYQQLQDRFPVLDDRRDVVDEVLDLYTSRNLYALQAIANKIDAEFHDQPLSAVFRLALAGCLLPASRLNGYPGRVASLRISGGHVRQPASRHHREVNVWRLFEAAYQDVRTALAVLGRDRRPVRFAADLDELGGMAAANLLWIRCRPAVVGQYLPPESIDLVIGSPPPSESVDELSFEYLATAWLLGREAAETLRLEPLFGGSSRSDGAEVTAFRHAMASAAGALKPGGWFSVLLEGDDPDRVLAVAVAGAAAELELVHAIPRESARSGDGVVLHFRRASAEDRLRDAVRPRPLRLGAADGHLTYPELAGAIERATGNLLRDRGEPAGLARIACAVLLELERTGLLRRLVQSRPPEEGNGDGVAESSGDVPTDRVERGGPALLAVFLREELWREDHPTLERVGDPHRPTWWLREPQLAADGMLADRVEWATFSLLTTAGRLDENAFLDRVFALFPGTASPDEELVRACLAAYASVGDRGQLRTDEDLATRIADHTRVVAAIVDFGHRLGLRAWVSRREQERPWKHATLGDLLREDERRTYLPLVIRAPADILGAVDALWYVRNRSSYLFEVEWTAMLGEAVLRRGSQIPTSEQQARFLVIPAERTELLRLKLARSPWVRSEIERQNWHVLKWPHLEALVAREGARIEWLEPMIGLDPLVERGGKQLTMFGE